MGPSRAMRLGMGPTCPMCPCHRFRLAKREATVRVFDWLGPRLHPACRASLYKDMDVYRQHIRMPSGRGLANLVRSHVNNTHTRQALAVLVVRGGNVQAVKFDDFHPASAARVSTGSAKHAVAPCARTGAPRVGHGQGAMEAALHARRSGRGKRANARPAVGQGLGWGSARCLQVCRRTGRNGCYAPHVSSSASQRGSGTQACTCSPSGAA